MISISKIQRSFLLSSSISSSAYVSSILLRDCEILPGFIIWTSPNFSYLAICAHKTQIDNQEIVLFQPNAYVFDLHHKDDRGCIML